MNYICIFHNFQMILKFLSLFISGYLNVLYEKKRQATKVVLAEVQWARAHKKKDEECAHRSVKTSVVSAVSIII